MGTQAEKTTGESDPSEKTKVIGYIDDLKQIASSRASYCMMGLIAIFLGSILFFLFPETVFETPYEKSITELDAEIQNIRRFGNAINQLIGESREEAERMRERLEKPFDAYLMSDLSSAYRAENRLEWKERIEARERNSKQGSNDGNQSVDDITKEDIAQALEALGSDASVLDEQQVDTSGMTKEERLAFEQRRIKDDAAKQLVGVLRTLNIDSTQLDALDKLQSTVDTMIEKMPVMREEQDKLSNVLSISITRVGAVMLAIFMMQILLSFYRYYTRLESYYDSQLLKIHAARKSTLESAIGDFNPNEIAFGKDPSLPIDKLIELLKR